MNNERGQASIEWIGLVLLLALGLGALARFAPGTDPAGLGQQLLHALALSASRADQPGRARGGEGPGGEGPGAAPRAAVRRGGPPRTQVTAPPLTPIAPRGHRARPRALPGRPGQSRSLTRHGVSPRPVPRHGVGPRPVPRHGMRGLPARLVRGRALVRRLGGRAGALYRRSWMFCLGYERVRYDLLHPESGAPHVGIPLSESLRMANDCVSPVDLVRDYDLVRGRP